MARENSLYDRSVRRLIKFCERANVTRFAQKNSSAFGWVIRTRWREHFESALSNHTKFSREFSATSFLIRAPLRNEMSTTIRIERVILYASFIYARARTYVYTREYVNEDARTSVRIHKDRSRRKSRCEIIMQKMHREDYDLICRAWKQFVSLEEGFFVNLRNYRLPRGCDCVQCFIMRSKNEVTKGKKKMRMFSPEYSTCIPKMRRVHIFSCDQTSDQKLRK